MELEKLVTARLLIKADNDNVMEVTLAEVSPSGEFAKVRRGTNGSVKWMKSTEIEVVEILEAQ